ncbi:MAG TPA: TfoX/Sxy family protein [Candidatus Binatia bacterium]|nr:TfoX/Sxy family protein [Candidatus Binatia bacterium]
MANDEQLAGRIRSVLADTDGVRERKMFGGLAVLVDGNMACGVVGNKLMLRLGRQGAEEALRRPNVRPTDFTGRPMTGMVYVEPAGLRGVALRNWVERAVTHARSLPPKL